MTPLGTDIFGFLFENALKTKIIIIRYGKYQFVQNLNVNIVASIKMNFQQIEKIQLIVNCECDSVSNMLSGMANQATIQQ